MQLFRAEKGPEDNQMNTKLTISELQAKPNCKPFHEICSVFNLKSSKESSVNVKGKVCGVPYVIKLQISPRFSCWISINHQLRIYLTDQLM
jgi:hypothetical protein